MLGMKVMKSKRLILVMKEMKLNKIDAVDERDENHEIDEIIDVDVGEENGEINVA